ncbi:MAG: OmpA family protein [Alphaproteobacteria bacterium]
MTAFNPIKLIYFITFLVAGTSTAATAQQFLGGNGQSNVVVDYSVIDDLGRSPTVPQLLLGVPGTASVPGNQPAISMPKFPVISNGRSSANSSGIVLRPPKAMRKRATPKRPKARKAARTVTRTARRAPSIETAPRQIRPLAAPTAPTLPEAIPAPPVPKISAPARMPVPTSPAVPAAPKIKTPAVEPKTRVASLSPIGKPLKAGSTTRIGFSEGSAKLNNDASARLTDVSTSLKKNDALRIQLLAYAGAKDGSASHARRLSLSRALAARSYLIEKGIRGTRIDVRALGNRSGNGPADRIDIIVTSR